MENINQLHKTMGLYFLSIILLCSSLVGFTSFTLMFIFPDKRIFAKVAGWLLGVSLILVILYITLSILFL